MDTLYIQSIVARILLLLMLAQTPMLSAGDSDVVDIESESETDSEHSRQLAQAIEKADKQLFDITTKALKENPDDELIRKSFELALDPYNDDYLRMILTNIPIVSISQANQRYAIQKAVLDNNQDALQLLLDHNVGRGPRKELLAWAIDKKIEGTTIQLLKVGLYNPYERLESDLSAVHCLRCCNFCPPRGAIEPLCARSGCCFCLCNDNDRKIFQVLRTNNAHESGHCTCAIPETCHFCTVQMCCIHQSCANRCTTCCNLL